MNRIFAASLLAFVFMLAGSMAFAAVPSIDSAQAVPDDTLMPPPLYANAVREDAANNSTLSTLPSALPIISNPAPPSMVKILGTLPPVDLTAPPPMKVATAPSTETAMPPEPNVIRNTPPVHTAAKITTALPQVASDTPAPPSPDDWTKLSGQNSMLPSMAEKKEADAAPIALHDDDDDQPLQPAPKPPSHLASRTHTLKQVASDDDDLVTINSKQVALTQPSNACRPYTRSLGPSGQTAAGTACLDHNGVWRIAEEHLVPSPYAYAAPVYVQPQPVYRPVYYAVPNYAPVYAVAGYGYGPRYYSRWH